MPLPDTPYILSANAWEFITRDNYADMRESLGVGPTDSPEFANLTLTSPSLASSAPVTISQTWNDLPTAFTALKVNATSTNSAASSKLLDLQVNGASQAYVDKDGAIYGRGSTTGGLSKSYINLSGYYIVERLSSGIIFGGYPGQFMVPASSFIGWNSGETVSASVTTKLFQDAANTLALRNGAAAQTFNVYGTWTTAITNFERLAIKYNTTDVAYQIAAEKGTTNGDYRPLQLWTGGASRLHITTAGNVGIGTTAPGALLHVVGNGLFGQNATSGTATPVKVSFGGTYGTSTPGSKANLKWDLYNDGALVSNTYGIGMSLGLMEFQTGTSGGFGFYPNASTTSALHIIPSGNVGIGTTSPTSKLHVLGGKVLFGDATDVTGTAGNGDLTLRAYRSPQIHISANTSSSVLYGLNIELNNNIYAGLLLNLNSGEVKIGGLSVGGYFPTFYADNVERMRISAAGNVGIGTPSPSSKLHVAGALGVNTSTYDSEAALRLTNTTVNSSWLLTSGIIGVANGHFSIRRDSVALPALVIAGITDNVGIGITTPTAKLHVAGTIKPEQATITTNATTAFTLDITHAGTVLTTSNAGNVTITLPAAGTVGVGYNVMIIQGGAGTITVAQGAGNTLNSFGGLYSSAGLHAAICIVCTAANTYNISGNLA